jgi:hypothetical protein
MGRRKNDKPDEPIEGCCYCEHEVHCVWTVKMGLCYYAMCASCAKEAQKDFFSFCLRTDEDRKRSKGEPDDSSGQSGE